MGISEETDWTAAESLNNGDGDRYEIGHENKCTNHGEDSDSVTPLWCNVIRFRNRGDEQKPHETVDVCYFQGELSEECMKNKRKTDSGERVSYEMKLSRHVLFSCSLRLA